MRRLEAGRGRIVVYTAIAALVFGCALVAVLRTTNVWASEAAEPPPEPAIHAIAAAFAHAPLVLLGEIHHSSSEHRFIRTLLRDPDFRRVVDDIVVEFGNARHQAVLDRYIRGESVPYARVRKAWEETTQRGVWSTPVYAGFFQSVRAANRGRPNSEKLRVLLGDPPIDLTRIRNERELDFRILQRDIHFAYIVQRNVLGRGRRALIVAGTGHVLRRAGVPTLSGLIEGRVRCVVDPEAVAAGVNWCDDLSHYEPASTFVIIPHEGFKRRDDLERRLSSWKLPSLAPLTDTWLGALDTTAVFDSPTVVGPPGEATPRQPEHLEEIADAYLVFAR